MRRKMKVKLKKIVMLAFLLFGIVPLVGCKEKNYPMCYYDEDLKLEKREEIRVAFDEKEFEQQQNSYKEKNKNIDDNSFSESQGNDKKNSTSDLKVEEVEKEYVEYENSLYEDKNSVYHANLSTTTIDNLYRYKIINKDIPDFDLSDCDGIPFEKYSELDNLGRSGVAYALLGKETMPKEGEVRGSIGMIKPSGWQTPQNKYDFIDGKYLFNRCHLIGWQLSAENSNEKNLITGTRNFNIHGMLPFENKVANYIKTTNNHVLYRVTPIFEGANLIASRVQIEAMSYEDKGASLKFNVLIENYEPNVHIDYATGVNWEEIEENVNKITDDVI